MKKTLPIQVIHGLLLALVLLYCAGCATAQTAPTRYDKGYRYSQDGWTIAHLEGPPHEIGYQYGYLMAAEIDDAQKTLHHLLEHNTHRPWSFFRDTAHRLFWSKLDAEYQQELTGIADGLKARGYAYDVTDLLAQNGYIDLSDYYLPSLRRKTAGLPVSGAPMACSAFIATGSATADGKIVMGHNFWWDFLTGQRFNLILDVTPAHGHRFVLDTFPGFIHSGTDFAINAAGIVLCETTISGFMGFDENGTPEFMRMRKATQYAANLDDFARIMRANNNGGYANTWLVGDTKTGEIGKLELGLKNVTFWRKHDGAYTGANYPEGPKLIAEECAPGSENVSQGRRARWKRLMEENQGKIDAEHGKGFLADTYDELTGKQGPDFECLCGRSGVIPSGAVNAKVVTAEMAKTLSFWARMNFPDGGTYSTADAYERMSGLKWMEPYLHDIPAHPWTLIAPKP